MGIQLQEYLIPSPQRFIRLRGILIVEVFNSMAAPFDSVTVASNSKDIKFYDKCIQFDGSCIQFNGLGI